MSVTVGEFERRSGVQVWQRSANLPAIEPGRFYGGLLIATGFSPNERLPAPHADIYFQDFNTGAQLSRVAAYKRFWLNHGPSPKPEEPWLSESHTPLGVRPRQGLLAGLCAALGLGSPGSSR